jgi:hypothetical protein
MTFSTLNVVAPGPLMGGPGSQPWLGARLSPGEPLT